MTSAPRPKRSTAKAIGTIAFIMAICCLTVVLKSIFGLLFSVIVILFYCENRARRRRNYVKSFNSAVRTTVQISGPLGRIAKAFANSGPLREQCANFEHRLAAGEETLDAAVASKLPLEIETAMALAFPDDQQQAIPQRRSVIRSAAQSQSNLSTACQLYYLIFITMAIFICTLFYDSFIAPMLQSIANDFARNHGERLIAGNAQAIRIIASAIGLGVISTYLALILDLAPRLASFSWMPLLPRAAERRAATLEGIATAIDIGCPIETFCQLGQKVSPGSQHKPFSLALNSIENGNSNASAIAKAGWIDESERAWIEGAPPQRAADIFRTIAQQSTRRADSNLSWLMAILFPLMLLILAATIAPFATAFFSDIYGLTKGLS